MGNLANEHKTPYAWNLPSLLHSLAAGGNGEKWKIVG